MNVFVEKIVSREKTAKDAVLKGLIVVLAAIVCLAAIILVPSSATDLLKYIRFIIIIAVVYMAYLLLSSLNVEYEYSITSDYIDIDKIKAQRKRKKVIRIDMESISIAAPVTSPDHATIGKKDMDKRIYAVSGMDDEDIYYIIAKVDGKVCLVYIETDDRVTEALKTYLKSRFKEQ